MKKRKNKRFISSIIALFSIVLFAVTSLVLPNGGFSSLLKADSSAIINITPYISSESGNAQSIVTTESTATGQTIKKNIIYISFEGKKNMSGEALISYTTVDRTAIAAANDYVATSGTVKLNAQDRSKVIGIEVNPTTFATSGINNGTVTRQFEFVITDVEYSAGGEASIAVSNKPLSEKRSITCELPYEHLMSANKYNGGVNGTTYYYYNDYVYDSNKNRATNTHDVPINKVRWYGPYFGTTDYYNWINDYVNTGLADVYAGLTTYRLYNSWACSAGDVVYTIYQHDDFTNANKVKELWYDYNRLYYHSTYYSDQVSGHINSDLTIKNFGRESITGTDHTGIKLDFSGMNGTKIETFVANKITDKSKNTNSLDDLKLRLRVDNDESVSTYSVEGTVYIDELLYDNTAPTYVDSYFDGEHAYIDGYVRVSMRFSEPVQVINKDKLYLNVKINNNNYRFKYESGDGTDTLVFSYEISKFDSITAMPYNKASFTGFYESENSSVLSYQQIGDFANIIVNDKHDCNRLAANFEDAINNVKLNLSKPVVKKETDGYSGPVSSRTVAVTVSECSNGTIYYKWIKEDDYKGTGSNPFTKYNISTMKNDETLYNNYLSQFNSQVIKNTTGSETFEFESVDDNKVPLHGNYYLATFVVSGNSKKVESVFGCLNDDSKPYTFDSVAPVFDSNGVQYSSTNSPKVRNYSLGLTDDGQQIKDVVLSYKKAYGDSSTYTIWKDGDTSATYDGTTLNFSITPEILGLNTNEYGYYDFDIIATDKCGNVTKYSDTIEASKQIKSQLFDTRNLFDVDASMTKGNACLLTTSIGEEAYLISETQEFLFSHTDSSVESNKYIINNLTYKGITLYENGVANPEVTISDYVKITTDSDYKIRITPKCSGKMTIDFSLNGTKYSKVFSYYFSLQADAAGTNFIDDTYNADKILNRNYVKSYVYQLSLNPYTYLLYDHTLGVKTENYNSATFPLLFSSQSKAKDYVEYMEKQDMCLVYLSVESQNIISALNRGGQTNYVKATGETKDAAVGQYWIRYKAENWTYDNQKWVYYFYGAGDTYSTINFTEVEKNANLKIALSKVSNTITSLGSYTYLTNEDYENAYGQLYVKDEQIRPNALSVTETKSGSSYYAPLAYYGDKDIYYSSYRAYNYNNDTFSYSDKETDAVPFVMQYYITASEDTRIYYETNETGTKQWKEMTDCNGKLFDSYFPENTSGIRYIMELDENGIHQFEVYVDHLAPSLDIVYQTSSEGGDIYSTLDYSWNNDTLGVTSITFKQFKISEADPYSYISIYKANYSRDFIGSYTLIDLINHSISLDNGSYYLVISDRFGNGYTVKLNYNTEEMDVSFKVSDDEASFSVICNREESQIYSYEVYCGDTLVSSTYAKSNRFYNSGCYFVKIIDIYGNEYDSREIYDVDNNFYGAVGYKFTKISPEVTWRYYNDGSYSLYKEGQGDQPMRITAVGSTNDTYYVSTAVDLMFTYSGEYYYEWLSDKPEHSVSTSTGVTRVTISSSQAWKLKVYYQKYPDVYVIYICEIDNTPPSIVAYYEVSQYILKDDEYFEQQAKEIGETNVALNGQSYELIEYSGESSKNYIRSGESIQTDSFYINVSDENEVSKIEVIKDGEKIDSNFINQGDGIYQVQIDGYGLYKIIATDIFGNSTNLQFENKENVKVEHYVDEKLTNEETNHGNTSDILKMNSTGSVIYMINNTQYLFYVGEDGIYKSYVQTALVTKDYPNSSGDSSSSSSAELVKELGYEIVRGTSPIISTKDPSFISDVWYQVNLGEDDSNLIFVKYNSEGFFIKVQVENEKSYKVNYSVLLDIGTAPKVYKSILSGEYSDIDLFDVNGKTIKTNHNEDVIKVSSEFTLNSEDPDLENVSRIRIAYSKTTDFAYYTTIYPNPDPDSTSLIANYPTVREGFYAINITNIFGNVVTYYINKSESMSVISVAKYSDGQINTYSTDYSSTIYANDSLTVTLYSPNGSFSIIKDGKEYSVACDVKGDTSSITISAYGQYTIKVCDDYGNVKIVTAEIRNESLAYDNDLIYGYNENASLKNQGYTNQKLSINYDKVLELNITAIYIVSDNGTQIVYDNNSESKVDANTESLKEVIGTLGTADYTVIFRDKYGNKVTKLIHYNEDGTLKVEYNYRSDTTYKEAVLDSEIEIYSNNSVVFTSTGAKGILYEDGKRKECPYTLGFSSYEETKAKDYTLTYSDEYGFSYTIVVHLIRQSINIALDSSVSTTVIDDIKTTRDDVVVNFPTDTTCTYSLDGVGEYPYVEGQKLVKDGLYVFKAVDKAGNVGKVTVAKDTSVQYQFVIYGSDTVVMNGGVVNGNVSFTALGQDTSYISIVVKDGELYAKDNAASTIFNEAGKYEVLIKDKMNNESYFSFYIISHALASFEYKTPYNYIITDAWIVPVGQYLTSFMESVDAETGFIATENGSYTISLQSLLTGERYSFSFVIDSSPSPVVINGVLEGETTTSDVTFTDAQAGDTFFIYKDGKLIKTVTLENGDDAPVISAGGTYKVVVRNAAGVEVTFSFTRAKIMNAAGSALIIVISSLFVLSLFAGLLFRKRSKIDR